MKLPEVFVISAARTAIGTFGGALKEVPLTQLATTAVREALLRSGVEPERIGHVVMGNVIPTDVRDAYLLGLPPSKLESPMKRQPSM